MEKQQINSVEVIINGEIVTLSGVESEEYFQRVARYLDKKIVALNKEKKVQGVNSFAKTLLISVNITDDLFKEKDEKDALASELEKTRIELGRLQEENILLDAKVKELQMELTNSQSDVYKTQTALIQAQKELNDYIVSFDKPTPEAPKNVYKLKKNQ